MKTLRIVDDLSATKAPVVKLTCDCGWIEKAFACRTARDRGEAHLKSAHSGGLMTYSGHAYQV